MRKEEKIVGHDKLNMKDTTKGMDGNMYTIKHQRKFAMRNVLICFLMAVFVSLAIWSLINYQGKFFSIILIMISTISSSIMALVFFPKIFHNCFILPFTLFAIFSMLTIGQGLQIADRNTFIKGCIFAEFILAINMVVSVAIGKYVKKHYWNERNDKV